MWDECGIGLCATMLKMWGRCGIFTDPHNFYKLFCFFSSEVRSMGLLSARLLLLHLFET